MASSYTQNYKLCQWEAGDKVLRTEFNADNAKIDAAIAAVEGRVSGLSGSKASISELNSVKNSLDSLSQTVSQHAAALTGKGNCQLYVTSYTGAGGCGENNQNSLTFPHKPFAVFLISGNYVISLFQGVTSTRGTGSSYLHSAWSGNTLRWYSSSDSDQLNQKGARYSVFALLEL